MTRDAFTEARTALRQKPAGPFTRYCRSCHGKGCGDCKGWGWEHVPGICELPMTGNECKDCPDRKHGCQR